MEFGTVILGAAVTIIMTAFGWVTHVQSRVSVLEQQHDDLKELINTRFDDIGKRLDRVERSLNGHLRD